MVVKSYGGSRKRSNCATIGLVALLGYLSSVAELWRKNGIAHFFWMVVKKPIDLIDIHYGFLFFTGVLTYLHYMLIRSWTKNRINRIGMLLSLFMITGGMNCLHKVVHGGAADHRHMAGTVFVQSVVVTAFLFKDILSTDLSYSSKGVARYLAEKMPINNIMAIFFLSLVSAWILTFFLSSYLKIVEITIRNTLDSISVYILLYLTHYTYIYNLNHFSYGISILSEENKTHSIENYIVLTNYDDKQITEKNIKEKNNEILYAYALDLFADIENTICAISKQQKIKNIFTSSKTVRNIPKMLLSEKKGALPILKDDIAAGLAYKLYFYIFSTTLYKRALHDAKKSQKIISRLQRTIWQMDSSCRKKIMQGIENVRKELREIITFETEELFNILGIWSFHFTT
ncbi:hypothetical protein NEMIN01_1281 [Nematocida minor]|uniref:uncharacterized protein n=1 Tax=Nematocida minor TaxID=1912983 RepID=UPI00221EC0EB|nr:uncharacterized protein NEMIN01_1281 [Nematocida minor]KAI5190948.1 hypothetical protein NEMIN01_1281 [Nematocida minor]